MTIWNVRGKYLDMAMIQRSGDMLTASGAGGINEIQYATLLMMIARHTGYEPGVFTHFVANEQIYDRHLEAANIMLERYKEGINKDFELFGSDIKAWKTKDKPMLVLNPKATNFFEMTIDDFTMENYDPIKPQLKLELGI